MRKLIKGILVFILACSIVGVPQLKSVSAKLSGDFSYNVLSDGTAEITNYIGSDVILDIPASLDGYTVTKIGYGAFAECKGLERVTIPDTVTTFGNYAFSQCVKLKSISIPDSVVSLGQNAFSGCTSLETFTIPKNMKSIGYATFYDCTSLHTVIIPEGVDAIGGMAFSGCRNLTAIELPSTLKTIGGNSFSDCVRLQAITIPNGVTTLGTGVFSGCIILDSVDLPETIIGIGQSAFQDCVSLQTIQLPDSVQAIGYSAFSGCSMLKDVHLPSSLSIISNALFSGCSSLESITLPETVQEIGENAFSGCISLKAIVVPDSVVEMGQAAFSNCSELRDVTLSKNLKTLEINVFRYCYALENIVIPNGLTSIKATAFADCINLKSVVLPTSVATFGSRVFSNCPNVTLFVMNGSEAHTYAIKEALAYQLLGAGLNLDAKEITLSIDTSYQFHAILYPYSILDNSRLTWTSSNPSIASVDAHGLVQAHQVGQVEISAKTDGGLTATCIVNVNDTQIPIQSISLNKQQITMKKESTDSVLASISPLSTTQSKAIEYTSSDMEVVSVSSTGKLTAKKPGQAVIRATTSNGLFAECEVIVISEIKSVTLNVTSLSMEVGSEQPLRATINPSDTTEATSLLWSSSNEKFATVDQNGNVKAIAKGTATISVVTSNGKKADCKVTIEEVEQEIPITSVTLDQEEVWIKKGQVAQFIATIHPSTTTQAKLLVWEVDDEAIVQLDQQGTITAIETGDAVITVTTVNGKTATCQVHVYDVDIAALTLLLEQAEQKTAEDYTQSSFAQLQEQMEQANQLLAREDFSQMEVDEMTTVLSQALSNLVRRATSVEIQQLIDLSEVCKAMEPEYDPLLFQALKQRLLQSDELLQKPVAEISQVEVQSLLLAITEEKEQLTLSAQVVLLEGTLQSATLLLQDQETTFKPSRVVQLKAVMEEVERFLAEGTYTLTSIQAMNAKLVTAIDGLEKIEDMEVLQAFSEYVIALDAHHYSEASWQEVELALQNANSVMQDLDASAEMVSMAYKQLIHSVSSLKLAVNKGSLKSEIARVEDMLAHKQLYVASSIKNLDALLSEAKALDAANGVTQAEVDEMSKKLTKAILSARKVAN